MPLPEIRHAASRCALAGLLLACLGGCGFWPLGVTDRARLDSAIHPVALRPDFDTRVYEDLGDGTADFFLTDLPQSVWDDPARLAEVSGQLAHVHLFIRPRPGSTPIEPTAVSATVRYLVLARGRVGVYAGGGFLLPRDRLGEARFAAEMSNATVSLVARGPGFVDQIETGALDLGFTARLDEEAARRLRRTADRLALSADPLPSPPP